ncbi:hypothetical protein LOK49_LG08G01526 [Camellia lanceoleosa]|uniref:Uncharacterized protein n=1 Tax=Camellia lanceoleosa TaxID=1840588 RepID=A0ACC0GWD6_9ERIC|nr:hypothetical protein LOK49_LG08G01526 [Camellia lanceoleosa]
MKTSNNAPPESHESSCLKETAPRASSLGLSLSLPPTFRRVSLSLSLSLHVYTHSIYIYIYLYLYVYVYVHTHHALFATLLQTINHCRVSISEHYSASNLFPGMLS